MKTMIAALLLIAGPAMAQVSVDEVASSRVYDQLDVEFLSWCENNNVMAQDSKGQVTVRANCSQKNEVCRTYHTYHHHYTVVSAICQAQ